MGSPRIREMEAQSVGNPQADHRQVVLGLFLG